MSAATPYSEDDRALAGEYVLGLLAADEHRAFETRLDVEPELRALYASWAEDLAELTAGIEPASPPSSVLIGIEAEIFPAKPRVRRAFAGWRGLGWLAGGAAAAAVAVLLAVNAGLLNQNPVTPGYTADVAADDGAMHFTASYEPEEGALTLRHEKGVAPEGRALELWVIAEGDAPVSLGVLAETEVSHVTVDPALRGDMIGATLAISDEPPGGSPTGAPTGSVRATGALGPV